MVDSLKLLKIYGMHISFGFRSLWSYKNAFYGDAVSNLIMVFSSIAGVLAVFNTFPNVQGWTLNEAMFMLSLNIFTTSICSAVLLDSMMGLGDLLVYGGLDTILIRPINPLLHLIFRGFNHRYLIQSVSAVGIFIFCCLNMEIQWSWATIFLLVCFCIASIAIYGAIIILSNALNFWVLVFGGVTMLLLDPGFGVKKMIDYPLTIYKGWIQFVLILVAPIGFISFFPAVAIIPKGDSTTYPIWFPFLGFLIAGLIVVLALSVWRSGIRRYNSSGS